MKKIQPTLPDYVYTKLSTITCPIERHAAIRAVTHDERLIVAQRQCVYEMVEQGMNNAEIGRALGIDPSRIRAVLEYRNRDGY